MTTATCNWPGCTAPAAAKGPRRCQQHYGRSGATAVPGQTTGTDRGVVHPVRAAGGQPHPRTGTTSEDQMSDIPAGTGLVKLTVNLLPTNYIALTAAAERDGDTRTDVVNRALAVYDFLSDRADDGWQFALLRGDELRVVNFE